MVPVEPISLTIGIAALFSTCIECFDYFKAGQEIEEDLEIILTKLDIEKTRLLIWGNGVGVLTDLPGDRAVGLSDEIKAETIKGSLKCINNLLSGAEKLEKEYGLQNLQPADTKRGQTVDFVSKNSMRIFLTSKLRFWVKHKAKPEEFGVLSKTKWAIHSKEKFEGLIIHLRDFIDGLYQVVPVGRESQDRLIEGDIASILDINKLRIVKSACDEASYRAWSDMASVVIEQSVSGTIDRRNFEERMRDIEDTGDAVRNSMNGEEAPRDLTISKLLPCLSIFALLEAYRHKEPFKEPLSADTSIYFVLARRCLNLYSSRPCQPEMVGKMTFEEASRHILIGGSPHSRQWGIGKRLANNAYKEELSEVQKDLLSQRYGRLNSTQLEILPISSFFIYCPVCPCFLQTALKICEDMTSTLIDPVIRPTDQLSSSCCTYEKAVEGLTEILNEVKKIDDLNAKATSHQRSLAKAIDRLWVEQRLFKLDNEENLLLDTHPLQRASHIFEEHSRSSEGWNTVQTFQIVLLAETETCLPIMQAEPFPREARIARENEIYQIKKENGRWDGKWERRFLGTFTPRVRKQNKSQTSLAVSARHTFSTTNTTDSSTTIRSTSPPPSPERREAEDDTIGYKRL